jgi:hypothetical protein
MGVPVAANDRADDDTVATIPKEIVAGQNTRYRKLVWYDYIKYVALKLTNTGQIWSIGKEGEGRCSAHNTNSTR